MKKCDFGELQLYCDGELPENLSRSLEVHLCGCGNCQRDLADLRQLNLLLSGFPELTPPVAIKLAVKARSGESCSQINSLLGDFLEGALPAMTRERLALHFSLCDSCRKEWALQKQMRSLMTALPEPAPPEKVRLAVQEALRQRRQARLASSRPLLRMRRIAAVGMLAGIALALAWVFPNLQLNNGESTTSEVARGGTQRVSHPLTVVKEPAAEKIATHPVAEPIPQPESAGVVVPEPARTEVSSLPAAIAARPRNLPSRHTALPPRVIEISTAPDPAEESLYAPEMESGVYAAAAPPAADASGNVPDTIAAARRELLRASEQYDVLQKEKVLSHMPNGEYLINTPIDDRKKSIKEPDANQTLPSHYV